MDVRSSVKRQLLFGLVLGFCVAVFCFLCFVFCFCCLFFVFFFVVFRCFLFPLSLDVKELMDVRNVVKSDCCLGCDSVLFLLFSWFSWISLFFCCFLFIFGRITAAHASREFFLCCFCCRLVIFSKIFWLHPRRSLLFLFEFSM